LRIILNLSIDSSGGELPSIYLQAENDKLVAPQAVDDFKDRIDNLHIHRLPGPHFLLQARALICAEIVALFISQLEK